jgi:hypothetical protein
VPPAAFSHGPPPSELLHFATRSASPLWTAEGFAAWLRARAAWRDTHAEPLPDLPPLERSAMTRMDLPAALIEAERRAPTAQVDRFGMRGKTDPLRRSSAPSAADGDTRHGVDE